jgi:hypothetical protein
MDLYNFCLTTLPPWVSLGVSSAYPLAHHSPTCTYFERRQRFFNERDRTPKATVRLHLKPENGHSMCSTSEPDAPRTYRAE